MTWGWTKTSTLGDTALFLAHTRGRKSLFLRMVSA